MEARAHEMIVLVASFCSLGGRDGGLPVLYVGTRAKMDARDTLARATRSKS